MRTHYGLRRAACGAPTRNETRLSAYRAEVDCAKCRITHKFDPSRVRPSGYTAGAWRERGK